MKTWKFNEVKKYFLLKKGLRTSLQTFILIIKR